MFWRKPNLGLFELALSIGLLGFAIHFRTIEADGLTTFWTVAIVMSGLATIKALCNTGAFIEETLRRNHGN